jgi:TorA maturation chaperone TorD
MELTACDPGGPERLDEDALRGCVYRLLARFLATPPDETALAVARGLRGDDSACGRAMDTLARLAQTTTPLEASDEYHALFIGLGRGELVPYASYYLTGFLNDRPLAALRGELAALGLARAGASREPEDHIASLCEVMARLIEGEHGPDGLTAQQGFFDRHLLPWAPRFFGDLERARASRLYAPIGTIGRLFMEIETTGFAMAA